MGSRIGEIHRKARFLVMVPGYMAGDQFYRN